MSVLPPGQRTTKREKQQKTHPTGYETEILISWILLEIDEPVDCTPSFYVSSLNTLHFEERKLLRFKVYTRARLFTYGIIEERQKVFTG